MSSARRGQEFCLHFPHFSLVIVPPSTPPPLSLLSWWWSCSFVDRNIREDFGNMDTDIEVLVVSTQTVQHWCDQGVTTGWWCRGAWGSQEGKAREQTPGDGIETRIEARCEERIRIRCPACFGIHNLSSSGVQDEMCARYSNILLWD